MRRSYDIIPGTKYVASLPPSEVPGAQDHERSTRQVQCVTGPAERQLFSEADVQRPIFERGKCPEVGHSVIAQLGL